MNNKLRNQNEYKEWFGLTFNETEIDWLKSIGIECRADNQFFKNETLDIYGFISNRKLKNNSDLYERFLDRYIELIPRFLRSSVDREALKSNKYYAAWYFNRYCFFETYEETKSKTAHGLLWAPLIDLHTPAECQKYVDKAFWVDDAFLEEAVSHWEKNREGCRCSLISVREKQLMRDVESGKITIWNKEAP